MWQQVREHEDLVEADFQRFYHLDYRDVYRPGGGPSKLTLRRALSLAAHLPMESLFKSELGERYPITAETAALWQLWEAWMGRRSPNWDLRRRQQLAAEHQAALKRERGRAQEHNAAFLAHRARRKN